MTDDELADVLARELRDAGVPADSLAARQLDALRTTYPGWEIGCDGVVWTAWLRRTYTAALAQAGVARVVTEEDPQTLASALARQVSQLETTWML